MPARAIAPALLAAALLAGCTAAGPERAENRHEGFTFDEPGSPIAGDSPASPTGRWQTEAIEAIGAVGETAGEIVAIAAGAAIGAVKGALHGGVAAVAVCLRGGDPYLTAGCGVVLGSVGAVVGAVEGAEEALQHIEPRGDRPDAEN